MNKSHRSYLNVFQTQMALVLLLFIIIAGCNQPDPFPVVPQVQFNNLAYSEIDGQPDSLILSFDFQDGDGDLGLPRSFNYTPFHPYDAITDENLDPVSISDTEIPDQLLRYLPPSFNRNFPTQLIAEEYPGIESLPPYSCIDYDIVFINENRSFFFSLNDVSEGDDVSQFTIDTILIEQNPARFNLVVDFYRKRENDYELIDWRFVTSTVGCGESFNGRFPILDAENIGSSLEGTVKYKMTSSGFRLVIRKDIFRLSFYVFDQHLNKSDTVFTDDFTLDDLVANPQ